MEKCDLRAAGAARPARAIEALAEVGLRDQAGAWPKTLSGGEAQRVALARALVREPDLLLLDEPFASLDALTRMKAQTLVAELWQRHDPAVLLVTHDVEEALLLADRIVVMRDGRFVRDRPSISRGPEISVVPPSCNGGRTCCRGSVSTA